MNVISSGLNKLSNHYQMPIAAFSFRLERGVSHSSCVSAGAGCPAASSSASYCFFRPFRYIRRLSGSSLEFLAACRRRVAR